MQIFDLLGEQEEKMLWTPKAISKDENNSRKV